MRHNPILSETDAFRLTAITALLVIVAGLVGWLTAPLIGVVLFVVAALGALVAYMRGPEPGRTKPLRRAARERHPHGPPPGVRRLLIVANEALDGDELDARIRSRGEDNIEVDVLAPVLTSRTHLATTDIDRERRRARERLFRSLVWANKHGIVAHGRVGDPSPTTALEDALRDFGADEVIVATGAEQAGRWQERIEIERLREELDVPVHQVTIG